MPERLGLARSLGRVVLGGLLDRVVDAIENGRRTRPRGLVAVVAGLVELAPKLRRPGSRPDRELAAGICGRVGGTVGALATGVLVAEWRGLTVAGPVEEVLKAVKGLKKAG